MSKITLEIKLKDVRAFEKDGGNLTDVFNGKVSSLADFLLCTGRTEDEVEQLFKDNGLDEVMYSLIEAFTDAGFLPKSLNVEEMKKQQEAALGQLQKPSEK